MTTVDLHTAKMHLSRLVDQAAAGEEIIIAKAGKPLAKLGQLTGSGKKRVLGMLAGKGTVPADFDTPLPEELLDAFTDR